MTVNKIWILIGFSIFSENILACGDTDRGTFNIVFVGVLVVIGVSALVLPISGMLNNGTISNKQIMACASFSLVGMVTSIFGFALSENREIEALTVLAFVVFLAVPTIYYFVLSIVNRHKIT